MQTKLNYKKIGLLADLHFGRKNNSKFFSSHLEDYLYNTFLPACEKDNVDAVFILGDLWESRRTINVIIFHIVNKFIAEVTKRFPTYLLIGNHDLYFASSFENNLLSLLENENNKNLFIIDDFIELNCNKNSILLCPYITKNNIEFFRNKLKKEYDYIFGHFNILEFYEGLSQLKINEMKKHSEEFSIKDFKVKRGVKSGHIHFHQKKGKITYIGSPLQYSFAHVGREQGAEILNLETHKSKFIKNNTDLYFKFIIETPEKFEHVKNNIPKIKDKLIKIYLTNKTPEDLRINIQDYFTLVGNDFYFFDIIDVQKDEDYDNEEVSEKNILNSISEDNLFKFIDELLSNFDALTDEEIKSIKDLFSDLFIDSKKIIDEKNKSLEEGED